MNCAYHLLASYSGKDFFHFSTPKCRKLIYKFHCYETIYQKKLYFRHNLKHTYADTVLLWSFIYFKIFTRNSVIIFNKSVKQISACYEDTVVGTGTNSKKIKSANILITQNIVIYLIYA